MEIESNLHPRTYTEREVVRVVNSKQQKLYVKHKCYPIDIYSSQDQDGNDVTVFIFLKNETQELYKLWLKRELD